MKHDLTQADVTAGQWVRALSRHDETGATTEQVGPVTWRSDLGIQVAGRDVSGLNILGWTLVSLDRIDPPAPPRPPVPTKRHAVVQLTGGFTTGGFVVWRDGREDSRPWRTIYGSSRTDAFVAQFITRVIFEGDDA